MLLIVYGRVSTEEQARNGYSLPEQMRACRTHGAELARATGETAQIVEFTDDTSGELLERPGLQAALELLRREKVTYFVCLDPDRLARRLMLQLLVTDQIEASACRLEFVQHDYHDTPEGHLFYQLRGAIAEFEKAKILERMSRGQRGKISAGGIPHLVRLYGYQFIKGAGRGASAKEVLVPDEHEADWVRTMFRWCADERIGPLSLAQRLNEMGVSTKTGRGLWAHTQVARILRHPTYATGQLALLTKDHRGIGVARRLTKNQRQNKGLSLTAKPKAPENWKYVEIDPIVDPKVWDQVQQVLADFRTGGRATGGRDRLRPLTGLGRCGLCEGPLYYLNGGKIVCANRYRHLWTPGRTKTECTLPAKPREAVEKAVWTQVRGWLIDPTVIQEENRRRLEELKTKPAEAAAPSEEIEVLKVELTNRETEVERLGVLYAKGLWTAEKALPAIEEANRHLQSIRKRLAELTTPAREERVALSASIFAILSDPEVLSEVQATIDSLDPERQAELIRTAVAYYEMFPSMRGEPPNVKAVPKL